MQPIKVTASSLAEALKLTSSQESLDQVDFELLSYQTFYRKTEDEEWFTLEDPRLENAATETEIRSLDFEVRQEYQFFLHVPQTHPYFDLRLSLAFDKYKSIAIAIISPNSLLPLKKGIQDYLKKEIHRHKLRAGLLIGITDNDLDMEINKLLLKIQKEGPLTSPYKMGITKFFPPKDPKNDNILYHYKKEGFEDNLIEGVHPNDLILEYIFAISGRNGRSCNGDYIGVNEPLIRYDTAITINPESIRAEKNTHSTRYYATRSGFVQEVDGHFSIANELHLKQASFRDTGSIETGRDAEVHVKINHKDRTKDAIGTGVNIDVLTLDVKGTVGSNTKIQACDVTIGAQTHKKSVIEVEETATIHLHRGDLKAKNATIEILEAGKIEAQTVNVTKMMGGEIVADHVIIDTLYSNANITALKSITIQNIVGDGNNLIIDPRAVPSYQEQINALELNLKESNNQIQNKGKELLSKEASLKEQVSRIKQIQEKIKAAVANNTAPLKADIVRIKQYKFALSELSNEQMAIKTHEEQTRSIENELDQLYDADLHAVITYHGTYNGHTRIVFIDPKTSKKHTVSPERSIRTIRLQREDDEKKIIFES